MKDSTKKVVILNNFVSPYVCEAIIILKDYDPRLESRAIMDAEKIVSDYIKKLNKNEQSVKPITRKKSKLIKYFIAAAIIGISAAIYLTIKQII
jgi:hypothetical protein